MKILIFMKNWLGDVLFEIPAVQAIRENFPHAHIVAVAPARCQEILEAIPYVDEIKIFDERASERSIFAKIHFIAWLRGEKFDKVFLFHRSFTRALLCWLGGIPERIGYHTAKRSWVLTRPVDPPRHGMHQVDYFLVLLKWAGLRVRFGAEYRFFYRPEDEIEALRILVEKGIGRETFVAFHIGANWEPKRWPVSHFARLADLVWKTFSCPIVLTGSLSDEPVAQEIIAQAAAARPLSLCGKTPLRVLGALYRQAAWVVSSDSGPLHIASGVGTPVVALFGPTSPPQTGPRGSGKKVVLQFVPEGYSVPWKGSVLSARGWMEHITPEEVLTKIQEEELWPRQRIAASWSSR